MRDVGIHVAADYAPSSHGYTRPLSAGALSRVARERAKGATRHGRVFTLAFGGMVVRDLVSPRHYSPTAFYRGATSRGGCNY